MGDVPHGSQLSTPLHNPSSGMPSSQHRRATPSTPNQEVQESSQNLATPQNQSPFQSQLQNQFYSQYQSRMGTQPSPQPPPQQMLYGQVAGRETSFNMASLGNALPEGSYAQNYAQQAPQRYATASSATAASYQIQHNPQYQTQSPSPSFPVQYAQHFQGAFGHPQQPNAQTQQSSPSSQFFPNQAYMIPPQQQAQQFFYPGGQYAAQSQLYGTTTLRAFPGQYNTRPLPSGALGARPPNSADFIDSLGGDMSQNRAARPSSNTKPSSVPRGPPRKPKQSGHALWVGNLPPGANVIDLKEHFSRDATGDILSVFLISKSNCAFVNYKTEESCTAAMARFHDSRFQGVRLVCRLRRASVNVAAGVPTGPTALASSASHIGPEKEFESTRKDVESGAETKDVSEARPQAADRYFIVKSLTVEDLELSVRNGTWATQSHNEQALNEAYEHAESVHLIFSANKSGEYFGYARMVSPINNDPAAAIEFAPKHTSVEDEDLPKATPTAATDLAPKGRIIDDSARGTIFWEAEVEETEVADEDNQISDHSDPDGEEVPNKAWGKPFKIEWQSTNKLPFYRTRGLRNPWNSNREVKIARDGTELETSVGRRVVQMFHHEPMSSGSGISAQISPLVGSYGQMRY